jgi:hypothetical protein
LRNLLLFIWLIFYQIASTWSQSTTRPNPGIFADSLQNPSDSLRKDTTDYLISPDAPDAEVTYTSEDSSYLDAPQKMFYLFGKAEVKYQSYELKAARIRLDMENDIAYAEGVPDSTGKLTGIPHFSDGEQEFDAVKMRYNFRTRKGIIDEAVSKYNDVFIRGTKTKFIGGDPNDTTQHDIIFNKNAILTSCNDPHPHFGVRSTKQKLVKDKMVIIGPSNLEIMGVPTPLWLPFGFFPVTDKRSAGLIIPRDYEYSQSLGFGLRDVGYYLPLGDHFDLAVQGDIYTRGSWGLQISSNYNKKYRYSGRLFLGYADRRFENATDGKEVINKSFSIQWQYNQSAQANPFNNFTASVNIQTNGFQQINFNDAGNVLNNSLSSNVNYSRTFPGKPYSLTASFSHSQNTQQKQISMSLPNLNFQMQRIYPFKRKVKSGDDKWYEQISFNYNAGVQSLIRTADSTFFSAQTINNFKNTFGVRQVASSDLNLRVLKYFNFTPQVNYREIWNLRSIEKTNPDLDDTIEIDTINKFRTARLFEASLSMNTILYGTLKFKKGPIRGIRHTVRPSVGLAYAPSNDRYGDYLITRTTRGRDTIFTRQFYSRFEGMTYDEISQRGTQLGVNYSLTHIFEAKYLSRKDSMEKKFKLFDNVYMNGFYNFVADSFKWSPLTMGGTTRLLGGLSTLSANVGFSFYAKDSLGRLNKQTLWSQKKFPLRRDQISINLGTGFSIDAIKELINKWRGLGKKEVTPEDTDENEEEDNQPRKPKKRENPETLWQMFKGFNFNHNYALGILIDPVTRQEKFGVLTHTINTQGSIELSKNWSIVIGNIGYDFKNKGLTYPDLGFTRILHCWRMTFSYQPNRGTYSFNIFADGSTFNFLKLPYRKNVFDPRDDL